MEFELGDTVELYGGTSIYHVIGVVHDTERLTIVSCDGEVDIVPFSHVDRQWRQM